MVTRWWHLSCCVGVIGAALATPSLVGATPVEDAYIAGYAAAILDQDLQLRGTSVSVHDGVVTVERADLDAAARRRASGRPCLRVSSRRGRPNVKRPNFSTS